jgi:hypothetical protein
VRAIYEYADLEEEIASIPQDVLVSFTDADIEWAAAEAPAVSRIEMHTAVGSCDQKSIAHKSRSIPAVVLQDPAEPLTALDRPTGVTVGA